MDAAYAAAIASFEVASAMASRPLPPWAPSMASVAVTSGIAAFLLLVSGALFAEARARASIASAEPSLATVVSSTLVTNAAGTPSYRLFHYEWSDRRGAHRGAGSTSAAAAELEVGSGIRVWERSGPIGALIGGGVPEPALAKYRDAWSAFVMIGVALALGSLAVAGLAARDARRRETLATAPLVRAQVVSTKVINPRVKPRLVVELEWSGGRIRHTFPPNAHPAGAVGFEPRVGDEAWVAVSRSDPSRGLPWGFAQNPGAQRRSER